MSKIVQVKARQLIDCKCRPMVEVDVVTSCGCIGRGSAPTGTSVGMYEAYILRDKNPAEYNGLSIHNAVDSVLNRIAPAIIGMDIDDWQEIDKRMIELDGTANKSNIGGNAIYSVSIACLRAAAETHRIPVYDYIRGKAISTIPVPSFNLINGGRYPHLVQPFNEFILVPYKAESVYEAVEIAVKCFQRLENIIADYSGRSATIAGSYGWAAPSNDPDTVLSLMQKSVESCGYKNKVAYALDCASSEMYDKGSATYMLLDKQVSGNELIDYVACLCKKYPMLFIEDLMDENAWDDYTIARGNIKNTLMIGDDLIASTKSRLEKAFELNAVDGFVLKPNQIGTITEALETYRYADSHGMISLPSGRAGGVVNDIIMDLAVGLEVPLIKNGAPRSGERIDKVNFLMRACDLSSGSVMTDISGLVRF